MWDEGLCNRRRGERAGCTPSPATERSNRLPPTRMTASHSSSLRKLSKATTHGLRLSTRGAKRVLRTVDSQPAGGAGLRAYPAVFRDRASGQERTLNLTRTQSLEEIKKAVCAAFGGWYDCELIDLDSGGAIALDAEYKRIVLDFESREVVRH